MIGHGRPSMVYGRLCDHSAAGPCNSHVALEVATPQG
jgi:hypothetical protein